MRHLLAALLLLACASTPSPTRCTAGQVSACPCPGGGSGAQACGPDGVFGACVCALLDAGADAPVDAMAPADAPVDLGADVSVDVALEVSADAAPPQDAPGPEASADVAIEAAATDACASSTPRNCCGIECPLAPNASSTTCELGRCGFVCRALFGNCDGDPLNGCETNLTESTRHCGACGAACAAGRFCMGMACVECPSGRADCDGRGANGCEINTQTDVTNCGSCGSTCRGGETCARGTCACSVGGGPGITCGSTCVNPSNDARNCGACGVTCSTPRPNAEAVCSAGTCGARCAAGFDDCDGMAANGCEADVRSDTANCGACGRRCSGTCVGGTCR